MPPLTCEIQDDDKLIIPAITTNINKNISDTSDKNKGTVIKRQAFYNQQFLLQVWYFTALDNWYPINVCRNAARQAAYTNFVLVCDIELMPSQGRLKLHYHHTLYSNLILQD